MKDIVIRPMSPEDAAAVLSLIKELAVYEKCEGEVEVNVEQMEAWGFGKDKVYDCFVAESQSQIVGIALYYYKYSTWKGRCLFLEDIVVTEKFRRLGIGRQLFNEVINVAEQEKVKRLEWQVLEWNEPAIRFYEKYRTTFDSEWINCRLIPPFKK